VAWADALNAVKSLLAEFLKHLIRHPLAGMGQHRHASGGVERFDGVYSRLRGGRDVAGLVSPQVLRKRLFVALHVPGLHQRPGKMRAPRGRALSHVAPHDIRRHLHPYPRQPGHHLVESLAPPLRKGREVVRQGRVSGGESVPQKMNSAPLRLYAQLHALYELKGVARRGLPSGLQARHRVVIRDR
jgi:hypothetical protein